MDRQAGRKRGCVHHPYTSLVYISLSFPTKNSFSSLSQYHSMYLMSTDIWNRTRTLCASEHIHLCAYVPWEETENNLRMEQSYIPICT